MFDAAKGISEGIEDAFKDAKNEGKDGFDVLKKKFQEKIGELSRKLAFGGNHNRDNFKSGLHHLFTPKRSRFFLFFKPALVNSVNSTTPLRIISVSLIHVHNGSGGDLTNN